jgi:adenylate cyclase
MERRLAAILAADVVGYSRLMEADEAGTLAALKAHRAELIDPKVAAHKGRVVKLMGDGALVEFASVVDAVECAVAILQGMASRNQDIPTDPTGGSIFASGSIWATSSSRVTISMATA